MQLLDEIRTTALLELFEVSALESSVDGSEIVNPKDVVSRDDNTIAECDIDLFSIPFKFPVPPLVFSVSKCALQFLSANKVAIDMLKY